jgi:ketosteroid isomerase-like protein
MFRAWEQGDIEAMLEFVAEDGTWHPSVWSGAGLSYHGHAGIREWAEQFSGPGQRIQVRAKEYRTSSSAVAVVGEVTEFRDDVQGSRMTVGWVFEIEEGKIIRGEGFSDPAHALRIAGIWD